MGWESGGGESGGGVRGGIGGLEGKMGAEAKVGVRVI